MKEKKCFKCGKIKPLSDFYKHPQMADGHINKCKDCNKKDVQENYSKNIDHFKEYDKNRAMLPHRVKAREEYQKTDAGKESLYKSTKKYRKNNPEKYKAHLIINSLIKSGKIIKPTECSMCGKKSKLIHGHHEDYNEPLDVIWVCPSCHYKIHHKYK